MLITEKAEENDRHTALFQTILEGYRHDESYEVHDAVGLQIAVVYFEDDSSRQSLKLCLTKDEARPDLRIRSASRL